MMTRVLAVLSCSFIIGAMASCATPSPQADDPPAQQVEQPDEEQPDPDETVVGDPEQEPVPRQALFDDPEFSQVRISADGEYISYLAPYEGVRNVWIAPTDAPEKAEPLTSDDDRGIHAYFWTYTDEHIVYGQDEDGDENFTLYAVDIETGDETRLTPESDVLARVMQLSPDYPDELLVQVNDREPEHFDVKRINIRDGESERVVENPGFAGFFADEDLEVRLAVRETPDGGQQWLLPDDDAEGDDDLPEGWSVYEEIPMEDAMTTGFSGFDRSGEIAYARDSRDTDTAALVRFEFDGDEREVLVEDERADVIDVMRHPREGNVQAAAVEYEKKEWTVVDDAIAEDLELLEDVEDGYLEVVNRTLDDDLWIVHYGLDDRPGRYYLYDREEGDTEFLFTDLQRLEDVKLNSMKPVVIEARDGLEMVSYLTVPHFVPTDDDGFPEVEVPMVLNVHGGPWARDRWGYNSQHQWLADRGYAVLSVNFRGSTGFGKDFLNAGNKEWGAAMHDDLIDAVEWAVDRGVTADDTVAIMGGSYGGYATLAGLAFTPDRFACGVNIVGVSNLITLLESMPPYWEPVRAMFTTRVGDPDTEEGKKLLKERSPLFAADQIKRPLLIAHGAHDPRVKQAESDQMVEALKDSDVPVTYALYPDEGHGFARSTNRISFYAIAEGFLSQCLGGRYEPIGDDFDGASVQILEGLEAVPGLAEAVERMQRDMAEEIELQQDETDEE